MLRIVTGLLVLTGLGCGGLPKSSETESVPPPVSTAAAPDTDGSPGTKAEGAATAEHPREPQPETPVSAPAPLGVAGSSVDLLRAVRTDLAVSSVYRENPFQIGNLVDGRLETAWNSKSGDLVGSWVAVRLPEEAAVETLLMTVGFTQYKKNRSGKKKERVDLFTGNHRITKVRVRRNGKEVGVFPLDPNSRELQTIPIHGPGGVYRIEIVEVLPGSKPKWREICISELQIMGHSPNARPNLYIPRFSTGEFSKSPPLEISKELQRKRDAFTTQLNDFTSEWSGIESGERDLAMTCDPDPEEIAAVKARDFMLQRVDTLKRLAIFLRGIDYTASARLEWLAERVAKKAERSDDLDQIESAILSVLNRTDDDALRCRWAMAHGALRFRRIIDHALANRVSYETSVHESELSEEEDEESPELKEMKSRASAYWDLYEALWSIQLGGGKNINPLENMKSLKALTGFAAIIEPEHDWNKLLQQVSAVEQTCPSYLGEMGSMAGVSWMPTSSAALEGDPQADALFDIINELTVEWQSIESEKRNETILDYFDPGMTKSEQRDLQNQCARVLNAASKNLEKLDMEASRKMKALAQNCSKRVIRDDDFDQIASVILSVVDRVGKSDTRCFWTIQCIELLLARLKDAADADYFTQGEKLDAKLDKLERVATDEEMQRMEKLSNLKKKLSDIHSEWEHRRWEDEAVQQIIAEIRKLDRQNIPTLKNNPNWKELMIQLEALEKTCSSYLSD